MIFGIWIIAVLYIAIISTLAHILVMETKEYLNKIINIRLNSHKKINQIEDTMYIEEQGNDMNDGQLKTVEEQGNDMNDGQQKPDPNQGGELIN